MRALLLVLLGWCTMAVADNDMAVTKSTPANPPVTVVQKLDGSNNASDDSSPDAARFSTDAQWEIAGYNMEEIIYTVLITSQDSRILRCRTQVQGHYIENDKLLSISDQQTSTVFPDQQVRVGNWTGLDKNSGATFTVKCHAL